MTTINDTETGDTKRLIIVDPARRQIRRKVTAPSARRAMATQPDFTKIVDGVRGDAEYGVDYAAPVLASREQIEAAVKPTIRAHASK